MAKGRSLTSGYVLNTDDGVINAVVAVAVVLVGCDSPCSADAFLASRSAGAEYSPPPAFESLKK